MLSVDSPNNTDERTPFEPQSPDSPRLSFPNKSSNDDDDDDAQCTTMMMGNYDGIAPQDVKAKIAKKAALKGTNGVKATKIRTSVTFHRPKVRLSQPLGETMLQQISILIPTSSLFFCTDPLPPPCPSIPPKVGGPCSPNGRLPNDRAPPQH